MAFVLGRRLQMLPVRQAMQMQRRMFAQGHGPRPGMEKWWKAYVPASEGEITHTLSPYEAKAVAPLFKNVPHKMYHWLAEKKGFFVIGFVYWFTIKVVGVNIHDTIERSHRA